MEFDTLKKANQLNILIGQTKFEIDKNLSENIEAMTSKFKESILITTSKGNGFEEDFKEILANKFTEFLIKEMHELLVNELKAQLKQLETKFEKL